MRESQKIFNQIFKKFKIIDKENFLKLIIYIELLIEHNLILQEEGYKYILIFYKILIESIEQNTFTSNILLTINNILKEPVYIQYSELNVDSIILLEKIVKLLLTNNLELQNIINIGLSIGINNDNKYIINGIISDNIREGLWSLASSTIRSFLNIDNDKLYGYTYIY